MFTLSSLKPRARRRFRVDRSDSMQAKTSALKPQIQPCTCYCHYHKLHGTHGPHAFASRGMSTTSAYQNQSEKDCTPHPRNEVQGTTKAITISKSRQPTPRAPTLRHTHEEELKAEIPVQSFALKQVFDDEEEVLSSTTRLPDAVRNRDSSNLNFSSFGRSLCGNGHQTSFFEPSSSSEADSGSPDTEADTLSHLLLQPSPLRLHRTDRNPNSTLRPVHGPSAIHSDMWTSHVPGSKQRSPTLDINMLSAQLGPDRTSCLSLSVYSQDGSQLSRTEQENAALWLEGMSESVAPSITEEME